jgi:hypothetical protein
MSMELDAVIESCVRTIQSDPQRTREEVALLLNRWEDVGLISRQMRAVIVQRLRTRQQEGRPQTNAQIKDEDADQEE